MTLENYIANHKPVMPASVARTTDGGLPTKELIDWEQYTLDFFDKTITDLDTRTDLVESATGDNTAAITTETIARTSADSALAADITTVTATANGATANGQVYLVAESAPSGYSAQYGWTLTAGNHKIGMKALVDGSGLGYIGFVANQFFLIDPSYLGGDPATVFSYDGITFNFDVPVTVHNHEIADGAVSNASSAAGNITAANAQTVALTTRDGARVVIVASIYDTAASVYVAPFPNVYQARTFNFWVDGSIVNTVNAMDTMTSSDYLGGSSYQFRRAVTPVTRTFQVTGLVAGVHTFDLTNTTPFTLGMSLLAIELAK